MAPCKGMAPARKLPPCEHASACAAPALPVPACALLKPTGAGSKAAAVVGAAAAPPRLAARCCRRRRSQLMLVCVWGGKAPAGATNVQQPGAVSVQCVGGSASLQVAMWGCCTTALVWRVGSDTEICAAACWQDDDRRWARRRAHRQGAVCRSAFASGSLGLAVYIRPADLKCGTFSLLLDRVLLPYETTLSWAPLRKRGACPALAHPPPSRLDGPCPARECLYATCHVAVACAPLHDSHLAVHCWASSHHHRRKNCCALSTNTQLQGRENSQATD